MDDSASRLVWAWMIPSMEDPFLVGKLANGLIDRLHLAPLDLARWLCEKLLLPGDQPPVPECYRLAVRLRALKCAGSAVPPDVALPLAILAALAHPANPPRPEEFDPLDLIALWPKVRAGLEFGSQRVVLRECHERLVLATADGLPAPVMPPIDDRLWSIHCSCEAFVEAQRHNRTPCVSAVALRHCVSGQERLLAVHRIAELHGRKWPSACPLKVEAELLRELDEVFRASPDAVYLHFNMNGADYGFEALDQRSRAVRGASLTLPPIHRRFDLSAWLKQRVGRDFAKHPHLHSLIVLNGLERPGYLSVGQAEKAWRRGQVGAVASSAAARAAAIAALYHRLWEGTLLTELGRVGLGGVLDSRPSGLDGRPTSPCGVTEQGSNDPWMSLADAERLTGITQGALSRAISQGKLISNGRTGKGQIKVHVHELIRFHFGRVRKPERTESNQAVEKKLRDAQER